MVLIDKFNSITENDTYKRIDTSYNLDIYLGKTIDGKLSLVIIENGKKEKVSSSNSIQVSLKERKDKKIVLEFKLLNLQFEKMFLVFCEDLIESTVNISKEKAISFCLKRWNFWKKMFSGTRLEFLSESKIKGLIGELLFLKNKLIEKTQEEVIESWQGPLGGHKDFIFSDSWHEIKTVLETSKVLEISSLEQLDFSDTEKEITGNLNLFILEKTNKLDINSLNLNKIVKEILDRLIDDNSLELFTEKLVFSGFILDDYYNDFNYKLLKENNYIITDEFPRILRKNISEEIVNVNYSINITSIEKFKKENIYGYTGV